MWVKGEKSFVKHDRVSNDLLSSPSGQSHDISAVQSFMWRWSTIVLC